MRSYSLITEGLCLSSPNAMGLWDRAWEEREVTMIAFETKEDFLGSLEEMLEDFGEITWYEGIANISKDDYNKNYNWGMMKKRFGLFVIHLEDWLKGLGVDQDKIEQTTKRYSNRFGMKKIKGKWMITAYGRVF